MNIENKILGFKIYDLTLGNRGQVRVWNFGELERIMTLSLSKEHTLKYINIGRTFYRCNATDEGKSAIQKFLSERRKEYDKYLSESKE